MTTCEHCRYPFEGDKCPNPACRVNVGEVVWAEREAARIEAERERDFRLRMWGKSLTGS